MLQKIKRRSEKIMLKKIILLISLVLGFSFYGYGETVEEGLSFYLSFDNNIDAKTESGIMKPKRRYALKKLNFEKGVKGEALIMTEADGLHYEIERSCFSLNKGTISLWVKANYDNPGLMELTDALKEDRGWFFVQDFLRFQCEPRESKMGLNLIQNYKGLGAYIRTYPHIGHFRQIKLPLEEGKWTHLLCVWDTEKRSFEVYIDGNKIITEIREPENATWDIKEEKIEHYLVRILGRPGINYYARDLTREEQKEIREEIREELIPEGGGYNHSIDEVKIYNRVLEEKEIESLSKSKEISNTL